MVFFGADGALLRAPFSLATRETLWVPSGGQRLVRVRVSPDGRRVAWLTRAHDRDTTRLWVDGMGVAGRAALLRARCPSVRPRALGGRASPRSRTARCTAGGSSSPNSFMSRVACNTLEWTPDSRAVVFGYDDGIAAVPGDGGAGFGVSRAFAVGLEALDPAPIYLVDAIVLREHLRYFRAGGPRRPSLGHVRALEDGRPFQRAGARPLRRPGESRRPARAPTCSTRWPAAGVSSPPGTCRRTGCARPARRRSGGRRGRHPRLADARSTATERGPGAGPGRLAGYDEAHRALVWAAGTRVMRRPEDGGEAAVILRTSAPIRAALPSRRRPPRGLRRRRQPVRLGSPR